MRRSAIFLLSFATFVGSSAVAYAWTQKVPFGVKVHDHALHDVELSATDCSITASTTPSS